MTDFPAPRGLHKMTPVQAYERGKADAEVEARRQARSEVLSILEGMYMDDSIERNDPRALAVLDVTREVATKYRERGL